MKQVTQQFLKELQLTSATQEKPHRVTIAGPKK